jgi:hypothetical protein
MAEILAESLGNCQNLLQRPSERRLYPTMNASVLQQLAPLAVPDLLPSDSCTTCKNQKKRELPGKEQSSFPPVAQLRVRN